MEVLNQEDRKILIIGIQASLILHLLLYIIIKLLPPVHLKDIVNQPIEIDIKKEDIKEEPKEVKISKSYIPPLEKKQEVKTAKGMESSNNFKNSSINQTKISENKTTEKPKKESLDIDESNLALLRKIKSGQVESKESSESDTSFGEPLSKIDSQAVGDALSRKVIYKPSPVKVQTDIVQPSVKAKIFISPSGDVIKVQLLTLTSDPNLNKQVVDYLYKWKFNPIKEDKTQYAVITVYFGK
ncbi:MAG: energy transducer TonB [Hydrogenothermaceae bacterium]|nr:energy transducer TonB [Hydrogenothermaceae bacterium]